MGSFAPYVSDAPDQVTSELALHAQVPLLNIRPNRVGGNGGNVRRKSYRARISAIRPDTFPTVSEMLNYIDHTGRKAGRVSNRIRRRSAAFQRSGICFVAGTVFEKYSVSSSYRGFSVALGIPSEADPRSRIEQMSRHAATRYATLSTLHQTVQKARIGTGRIQRNRSTRYRRGHGRIGARRNVKKYAGRGIHRGSGCESRIESLGFPVIGLVVLFVPSSEEAQSQSEVHS